VDPCASCGATMPFDADACPVCSASVRRLTPEERARRNRGPKLAAVVTLVGLGVVVLFAEAAMMTVRAGGSRGDFYMVALGVALIGAGSATWRDL